jgi:hypothetical protein
MHNFLKDILKESNTIIIPGLGALTVTSAKTGDIYFMPFLKHDDGHLAKYVSEHEGVELSEAKQILSNFVEAIKTALSEDDYFEMEDFGRFLKNKEGEIDFQRWEDYQTKDNSILSKKIQERQQTKPKTVPPVIEVKKEEPKIDQTIQSDEIIHHQLEEELPISPNPIHLSLEETIIHPISEIEPEIHSVVSEKKSIDEILGEPVIEAIAEPTVESIVEPVQEDNIEIKESIVENQIVEATQEDKIEIVEPIVENQIIENTQEENIVSKEESTIENEPIVSENAKALRKRLKSEKALQAAEVKKAKKAAKIEQKELEKSTPKEKKKSRSLLLWLVTGIILTGGVMWYIKTQRDGEVHLTVIDKKESKVVASKVVEKEDLHKEIAKHKVSDEVKEVKEETKKIEKKEIKQEEKKVVKEEKEKKVIQTKNKPVVKSAPEKVEVKNKVEKPVETKPVLAKKTEVKVTPKETPKEKPVAATPKPSTIAVKTNTPVAKPSVTPKTPVTTATNSTKANTTPVKTTIAPTTTPTSGSTAYVSKNKNIHVIAASFKDKENADKFVETLKKDGFSDAYAKLEDGVYQVSLGSYSTLSESYNALKKYKGGKTWVKEVK